MTDKIRRAGFRCLAVCLVLAAVLLTMGTANGRPSYAQTNDSIMLDAKISDAETDNAQDNAPDNTPRKTPDAAPDNTPRVTQNNTPDKTPNHIPEKKPADPDDKQNKTPAEQPGDKQNKTPESAPDNEPNQTPDVPPVNTPNNMPDDAPVELSGKINAALRAKLNSISDDEVITVWLWLKDLNAAALEQMIRDETGFDPYNSEYSQNGNDPDIIDQYIEARRSIIKREYSKYNDAFIANHVPKDRKILYNSRYTSTLVVEATKSEIIYYADLSDVTEISLYEEQYLEMEETAG